MDGARDTSFSTASVRACGARAALVFECFVALTADSSLPVQMDSQQQAGGAETVVGMTLAMLILSADLAPNGFIGGGDLAVMLQSWGGAGAADLNEDGAVDSQDLLLLLSIWGAGWGRHDTGDGQVWFVAPGDVVLWGSSPFVGYRRLTFVNAHGDLGSIDMLQD